MWGMPNSLWGKFVYSEVVGSNFGHSKNKIFTFDF